MKHTLGLSRITSLKINPTKTEVLLFKTRQRNLATDFSVSFKDSVLRFSSSDNVLGIVIHRWKVETCLGRSKFQLSSAATQRSMGYFAVGSSE